MQKKGKRNAKEMQKFISEMQKKCKNSLSSFLQMAVNWKVSRVRVMSKSNEKINPKNFV